MMRIAIALLTLACAVQAQTTIRLGTLAPRNSRWHQLLLQMGEKWKEASGGAVLLKIYPGGEQGDEPEMVQKMRIKALQAVAISGAGLSGIDGAASALQIPLMYESWDELDYVRDRISPRLEKGMADFRKIKICVLQGDATNFELYKRNGFQPVSLAATDILTGLQTGLIDAFQAPPAVALGSQWFGGAKNMLDIKFAPLSGATLISKDAWEQIPPKTRTRLMEISHVFGPQIREEIHKLEDSSIALMQGFNLNVVKADPKGEETRALLQQMRNEYRAKQAAPKPAKAQPRTNKK